MFEGENVFGSVYDRQRALGMCDDFLWRSLWTDLEYRNYLQCGTHVTSGLQRAASAAMENSRSS